MMYLVYTRKKKIHILKKLIAEICNDKLEATLCTLKGLHVYSLFVMP